MDIYRDISIQEIEERIRFMGKINRKKLKFEFTSSHDHIRLLIKKCNTTIKTMHKGTKISCSTERYMWGRTLNVDSDLPNLKINNSDNCKRLVLSRILKLH